MRRSLRWTLLVRTTVASTLILGCLGVGLYLAMRETLLRTFDATQRAKGQALAAMVEEQDGTLVLEFDSTALPEFVRQKHPSCFEMWTGGKVWQRSANLGTEDLDIQPVKPGRGGRWLRLKSGHWARVVTLAFTPRTEEDDRVGKGTRVMMAVAGDTEDLQDQLAGEAWIVAIACALAVAVSGVTLVLVVNGALRPLAEVGAQIESLREGDLSMRVQTGALPVELLPVVERLNRLLGRLEQAFERERGFTADAAHELRTPLAGMKATLEVCRSRSRDEAGYAAAIDKSLAMVGAMQRMVENLLMLSRAEGGQLQLAAEVVDVEAVITEAWETFAERAKGRGLQVDWDRRTGCFADANAEGLRMVMANVLENAVTYADVGGSVRLVITGAAERTEIVVSNTGSSISEQEVARVFERFWRHDSARSQTGVHAGLGLSLCERLVRMMGGRMTATSAGGVFAVSVVLKGARVDVPVV